MLKSLLLSDQNILDVFQISSISFFVYWSVSVLFVTSVQADSLQTHVYFQFKPGTSKNSLKWRWRSDRVHQCRLKNSHWPWPAVTARAIIQHVHLFSGRNITQIFYLFNALYKYSVTSKSPAVKMYVSINRKMYFKY